MTRKLIRKRKILNIKFCDLASDNEQPIYENLIQTDTIIYQRQDTAEIQITNLDEENDDIILHEDHIYYAHVNPPPSNSIKFFFPL